MNALQVRPVHALITVLFAGLLGACTTGEGEGVVRSDKLFVRDCWDGEFDLKPDFFGANPFTHPEGTELFIRIQRGDNTEDVSDGVLIVIEDVGLIRKSPPNQAFELGLPAGVTIPGQPVVADPDPPKVSLSLYLMDTCQAQNPVLVSVGGSIRFSSLFSGDPNENDAADRLTAAEFTADITDPRTRNVDGTYPEGTVSTLTGWFDFYFQRGQPAQPFP